jgi:hypothetical protein
MAAAQYAPPPYDHPVAPYDRPAPPTSEPPDEEAPSHRQVDFLGSRLDFWHDGVSTLTIRYLHMYEHGGPFERALSLPAVAIGLGAEAGAINVSAGQDSDKGAIVDAVLRGAVRVFSGGGISAELTSGMATGPGGPIQVGSAGVFWSMYVVDVGYSYGFPLASAHRPEWLSSGMFSLRLQIPFDGDRVWPTGQRSRPDR